MTMNVAMEINRPEIVAEVSSQADAYETALQAGDLETLAALFWADPHTLRFGPEGPHYGHAAIVAFRAARPREPAPRQVLSRRVTTYGRDAATTHVEFQRPGNDRIGQQSQTWMRMAEGWRIVAAHVAYFVPQQTAAIAP